MAKTQFPPSSQKQIPAKRALGAAASLLIFFLLMTSVIGLAEKYFAVKKRNRELTEESTSLQQKEVALAATNAYITSPEGTEQSLRERYNYVKPGEEMILISPEAPAPAAAAHQSAVARWWEELLQGIGLKHGN